MYSSDWNPDQLTLLLRIFDPVIWTFHSSMGGRMLVYLVKFSRFTYLFRFSDATLQHGHITPIVFGGSVLQWLVDFLIDRDPNTPNGDIWYRRNVRIQVWKKGISSGRAKSQEWASRASRKKAITERAWKRQVWITLKRLAVSSNRFIEREPPETFRLVTASRRERSAKLLSGGTEGSSRKYHHCFALSRKDLSNKPAA